jgi:hypothetical protein
MEPSRMTDMDTGLLTCEVDPADYRQPAAVFRIVLDPRIGVSIDSGRGAVYDP